MKDFVNERKNLFNLIMLIERSSGVGMEYDFDREIERRDTDSIKWSLYPEDVIPLWVADMDFRSAEPILQALHRRIDHAVFGYSQPSKRLAALLQGRLMRLYGWQAAEPDILFIPGIVSGLNIAFQAFAAPGEGILAQSPVYFHFLRDPVQHGRVLHDVPLAPAGNSYEIDFERLEKAITPHTRLFALCNPHNPVGRVFTRAELERIADICLKHGLIICSDEIHCDLVFPPFRHIPIATLSPEVENRTVTLMSPSKTYNIAGLDCGYALIKNPDLRRNWQAAAFGIVPHVNIMGHVAALAALSEGRDWLDQVLVYLRENRDFLAGFLNSRLPALRMCAVEATYLAWIDCRNAEIKGNPSEFFLKEARTALNDGSEFGPGGENFVRLNFACPRNRLLKALERMEFAIRRR
jgi:cysteine-S-conjugate beta-lyase